MPNSQSITRLTNDQRARMARLLTAADIPVNNNNDDGAGSLRQAITDAGSTNGFDVIDLSKVRGAIKLNSSLVLNAGNDIEFIDDGNSTLDGDGKIQILKVNDSNIVVSNLTFANGYARGGNGQGGGGVSGSTLNQKQNKVLTSGKTSTKRCVSETKKKFVAAQQGWKCGHCKRQLPAWYEVDHITRLEHGGTNHIDNLVALCRDCHGKKTAIENL